MTATETRRILDCRHVRGAMHEQPDVLARMSRHVEFFAEQVGELAAGNGGFQDVVFLAPPRAQSVALLGRHSVAVRCALPTPASNAESAEPGTNPLDRRLVIALSPSGEDERVLELAQRAMDAGSPVVAVTNDARSPLARIATRDVDIAAGLELSASPTKSVTGMMLAALALVDGLPDARTPGRFAPDPGTARIADPAAALGLAEAVGELLEDGEPADAAAARLVRARRVAVVGEGHHHPAALETARMLRETAGLLVEGFSVQEFCSGPMDGFDDETAVVLLTGRGHEAVRSLRARLRARSAHVVVIGGDLGDGAEPADLPLPALGPTGAPECIPATVRGQQLAVAAARALGVDPDRPAMAEVVAPSPDRARDRAGARSGTERGDGPGAR